MDATTPKKGLVWLLRKDNSKNWFQTEWWVGFKVGSEFKVVINIFN